jgi:transglutaminase-like putative cysteine protease
VDILKVRILGEDGQTQELYQVFEQSLSEPWYNLYYDHRALILSFPPLSKGDVLEVQYKVSQTGTSATLGDYFGDVWFAQGEAPKLLASYAVIVPQERALFVREPKDAGCAKREEALTPPNEKPLKVLRFDCKEVAEVPDEAARPGFSEVAQYVHVSTYQDWAAVGRWYWALVEDQLVADKELRAVVAEATQGLTDERQKVSAIHNWVVQNTRYVGLEFGIHGFKPYRTTLCLRRRFGDCKDKASLIKVMLNEAGIDANLVLVRTRRNGSIEMEPPSLQLFDHAIAYVPKYDLFLDGTAEFSGTRELPWGDQGVPVVIIQDGGGAVSRATPVFPAKHNALLTTMDIDLDQDEAVVDASLTVTGVFAADYRQSYETEQDREDTFGQGLAQDFPGAKLVSLQFSDLSALEQDVKVAYRYTAPCPC